MVDCETARQAISALLVDDEAPGIDRRALEDHLASCAECSWPAALIGPPAPGDVPSRIDPVPPRPGLTAPLAPRPGLRAPAPQLRSSRPARRRRRLRFRPGSGYLFAAVAMLIVAVIAGPYLYFHVVEGKAPAPLTLPVGPGGTTGPINGTWSVSQGSQAEYRVHEVLFDQHHLAVGKTSEVSGTMTIVGATVTSARIKVDMASIHSDNPGRDTVFRDHLMDTDSHPDADFTLTRPIDMDSIPANGATVEEQATGSLALRGVTRQVTFPLSAKRVGARIDVVGDLTIRFGLWHIPDPSFAITSVSKDGTIDLLLSFTTTTPSPSPTSGR